MNVFIYIFIFVIVKFPAEKVNCLCSLRFKAQIKSSHLHRVEETEVVKLGLTQLQKVEWAYKESPKQIEHNFFDVKISWVSLRTE